MRFDDRLIVLTGAGREGQVAEAVAAAFVATGARLALVGRDAVQVEARAEALRARGHEVAGYAADLADATQVEALVRHIVRDQGSRIDALVNVAGGFAHSGPVAEADVSLLPRQIAINLTTAYHATRYLLPFLRATRGAVVYFASEAVLPGGAVAGISAYAAAKAGVVALMRAIAEEERDRGVRANAVAPSAIRTSANVAAMGSAVRYVEREQVADAVLYLCSEGARAITGQVIKLE
jgi:NAD(P)-dependent dehydrogenase (short-subunit alcohol dehydrogenase family)